MRFSTRILSVLTAGLLLFGGCSKKSSDEDTQTAVDTADIPALQSKADSIAMNVLDAFGGHEAWAALRYLRFDFGVANGEVETVYRKHLWDRLEGNYRVEWTQGNDSSWVVLLNVNTREGEAFLNGRAVEAAAKDSLVMRGFQAYVNDTYWLLAPVKLLETGAQLLYLPGWSDEQFDVITAIYEAPGFAPDDQFWFWIDKDSSKLMRFAYVRNSDPSSGPLVFEWGDYESYVTEAGTIKFITRKTGPQSDLLTNHISVPSSVPEGVFSEPSPQL